MMYNGKRYSSRNVSNLFRMDMWVEAFQGVDGQPWRPLPRRQRQHLSPRAVMNDTNALFGPALSSWHRRCRRRTAPNSALTCVNYKIQTKCVNDDYRC